MSTNPQTAKDDSQQRPPAFEENSSRFQRLGGYLNFIVPALFGLAMGVFYPFLYRYEFDTDEGINLMKAALLEHGAALYSQIWSDQPPFFTQLLAAIDVIFGTRVDNGRILVLAFSILLLAAAFATLRSTFTLEHALAGVLLVVLLPYYLQLSVSAMIGLPSLALAMLSLLGMARWHQRRSMAWLVISALALSASVLTKLFTLYLAPVFTVGLLLDPGSPLQGLRQRLRPALVWGGLFLGVILGNALFLVHLEDLQQLIAPHLHSIGVSTFENQFEIEWYMKNSWPTLLLALVGCILALRSRRWIALYLAIWALGGYLLLKIDHPIWYHQQLLVTVPAALLAGIGVGEAVTSLWSWLRSRPLPGWKAVFPLLTLGIFAWVLIERLPPTLIAFSAQPFPPSPPDELVERIDPILRRVERYANPQDWAVSDRLMIPFRAGMLVPPELAVFSSKRLESGNLSQAYLIEIIRAYQPSMVIFTRFDFPQVNEYLQTDYVLVYELGINRLFVRRDLVKTGRQS